MTNETPKTESCKVRLPEYYRDRMADLRKLWKLYQTDPEASDPDLGNLTEYGLSFDYVSPGTFNGQRKGYFRYQISWGGPAEEFRFFVDERLVPDRVEFWFLDWFDGAKRILRSGPSFELLCDLFEFWTGGEPSLVPGFKD